MADIKTRNVTRGTIKTLDRLGSSTHRVKEETIKSRNAGTGDGNSNESEASYISESLELYAGGGASYALRTGAERMLQSREKESHYPEHSVDFIDEYGQSVTGTRQDIPEITPRIQDSEKGIRDAFSEQGIKAIRDRQNRRTLADKEVLRDAESDALAARAKGASAIKRKELRGYRTDRISGGASRSEKLIMQRRKEYAVRRIRERSLKGGFLRRIRASARVRNTGRSADRMRRILRDIAGSAKSLRTALAACSSAVVLILVVVIICGGVFATVGDENGNDFAYDVYGIGYGDTAIVRVAEAQLGIIGGDKFWKWYGFNSHVDWCAIFVSWCGNECGYIREGIIPKFSVVGDGAKWFRDKGQWASRGYTPKSGDIIFFDYEGDGLLDHVGIVESCDGRYVTTIEGNSGNVCKRNTYVKGSRQIAGYGVPMYGMLMDPGDSTLIQANMVAWAKKIAADNTYGYKDWIASRANTHKCPICHPGSGNGWNCIGFAFACWRHGGGLSSKCNCSVIDDGTWQKLLNAKTDADAVRIASKRIGVPVIVIRNNGNTVPQSKIRAGDICGCFNGRSYYHTTFSIGNGEIIHCTGASSQAKEISKRKAIACKVVIRYAGMQ